MVTAAMRPLCRYCGSPIPKRTRFVYFGADQGRSDDFFTYRTERPRSKEEAQSLFNQTIVSVSWVRKGGWKEQEAGGPWIYRASLWDGESYSDQFFCKGPHAQAFAYAAARSGNAMQAYFDAKAKQERG